MDKEIDKEWGVRERAAREIEMIIENNFSFANEEPKEEEKKDVSLTE